MLGSWSWYLRDHENDEKNTLFNRFLRWKIIFREKNAPFLHLNRALSLSLTHTHTHSRISLSSATYLRFSVFSLSFSASLHHSLFFDSFAIGLLVKDLASESICHTLLFLGFFASFHCFFDFINSFIKSFFFKSAYNSYLLCVLWILIPVFLLCVICF